MAFSSSPYRHESDGRSSSSVDTSDIEADFLDESSPVKFNAADRSQDAATLGVLGALNDSYQCSLRTPDIKAGPCAANIESHTLTRHPDRQLPYQQAYSSSLPRKRKYKVTTMAGSPLKLRISRSDGKSFGLADSGDKPSPWDALAGENSPSSRGEPLPDRRAVPSWQQAAFSARAAFMQPPGSQAHPYMLRDGDQLYEVATRPFIALADEVLIDIYRCLCEVGLPPLDKTTPFGFMFVKPAWQPLPFQSQAWVKISRVRLIEDTDKMGKELK